jgi:hypothetical protein
MNMGFHRSLGTEPEQLRQSIYRPELDSHLDAPSIGRPSRLKQLAWVLLAVAVAYLLTILSVTLLWTLAAVLIGLIALATAVCIYAQNNTW